jgi:hypothetical protein
MANPYPLNTVEMTRLLEIESILKDESYSSDHSLVLKLLSDLNYHSSDCLRYLSQSELDQLIGFMKPGVPKRRLTILLNNGYTGGGGGTATASATTASATTASATTASSSSASATTASSSSASATTASSSSASATTNAKHCPLETTPSRHLMTIHGLLMHEINTNDNSLVLQFLSNINCRTLKDLRHLNQSQLYQLTELMEHGDAKIALVELLKEFIEEDTDFLSASSFFASTLFFASSSAASSSVSSSSAASSSASSACPAPPKIPKAFSPGGECQVCLVNTNKYTSCGHQLCAECLSCLSGLPGNLNGEKQCPLCEKPVTNLFEHNAVPSLKIHPMFLTPDGKALFREKINTMREFLAPNANTADI